MGGIDTNLTDEEALKNFLLDIDCLNELQPWTGHFNLFDVLKISRTEIRHSNVLSWLLNRLIFRLRTLRLRRITK